MPRKTLKEREQKNTDTDNNINRIRKISDNLVGKEDPDDLMLEILDTLKESGKVPEVGKYYVFVYTPKTPNIQYDQNPLVAVTDVYSWGFRGINFHWRGGQVRQYTWSEVPGQLYEIYRSELKDLYQIPFAKIRINN